MSHASYEKESGPPRLCRAVEIERVMTPDWQTTWFAGSGGQALRGWRGAGVVSGVVGEDVRAVFGEEVRGGKTRLGR